MMGYAVVFLGAGIGGAIRHGMNIGVGHVMGTHFPWHTFVINILGSLVMGLVAGWFTFRADPSGHLRLFLTTGILGGFTTFSAFGLETVYLLRRGETWIALAYALASVMVCVAAVWIGLKAIELLPRN